MAVQTSEVAELVQGIPAGAWVAISETENRVLSYGMDPMAVVDEARKQGEPYPLAVGVPELPMMMFFKPMAKAIFQYLPCEITQSVLRAR